MALGFIIFGWPKRTKNYGPAYPHQCPACGNPVYFDLIKKRRWLTVFFIPLLPLTNSTYVLSCEFCGAEEQVRPECAARAIELTNYREQVSQDELAMDSYEDAVAEFEVLLFNSESESKSQNEKITYKNPESTKEYECSRCGTHVGKTAAECPRCELPDPRG